jgi:cysteine desulfurase/selenocysteine lyase
VDAVRSEFPIFATRVRGKRLVYLDNAATTQKPRAVIDALRRYYEEENANIHRGVHYLSERATDLYEKTREQVRRFIGAGDTREIVFVRGATEGINLVAATFGGANVRAGDEVLITAMEHHSNIVPWQMLCEQVGAKLRVAPINDAGELLVDELSNLLNARTKLLAITHVSNALGSVNPMKDVVSIAHSAGVPVVVDGAQAVPHLRINVRELDCDFYTFSSHKMYGPTGIGVLYGKLDLLNTMPPYQGGGDMIKSVTFEKTIFNDVPYKFEAGTPNIADGIAFGAALEYLSSLDWPMVTFYEQELLQYATEQVKEIEGVRIVGTARDKAGVLSFVMEGVHPHDIGTILDQEGIAVRTGHHCAQPVMQRFGIPATVRASFGIYNTKEEVDVLVRGLHRVKEVFN